ncbi:MAG: right-handed parallel beta-helix repeat-containing protein [Candidatus Tectomicrobia bacterium]
MARPTIIYNASSGSDTAASGAGPATALTGTNAVPTGQVIALDGSPDLSGVNTDGTHALWFESTDSASNRRLFRITAKVAATSVTVVGTIVGTGVNWAIGGKRKTLQNGGSALRDDWLDAEAGWTYEFEAGTYTIDTPIDPGGVGDDTDGPVTFQSSDIPSVVPVITTGTTVVDNVRLATIDAHHVYDGLKFTRTDSANVSCIRTTAGDNVMIIIRNCELDCDNMTNGVFFDTTNMGTIDNCDIHGGSGFGFRSDVSSRTVISKTAIHDFGGDGICSTQASSTWNLLVDRCLIYDNGNHGIDGDGMIGDNYGVLKVFHTVFDRNTVDGISLNGATWHAQTAIYIEGCVFTSNGGYGVDISDAEGKYHLHINRNNHYDSNTSGARNGFSAGDGDTSGAPGFTSVTDGSEDYTPAAGSVLIGAGPTIPTA